MSVAPQEQNRDAYEHHDNENEHHDNVHLANINATTPQT